MSVRKRFLTLCLCLSLCLTGCAAMLDKDDVTIQAHSSQLTPGDSAEVQLENRQELMSAILNMVSNHQESGSIALTQDMDAILDIACSEVHYDDPLGAYAVDYIRHESTHIVTYYRATITIGYKRSLEQIKSIIPVTGSAAIRREVSDTLRDFSSEAVLRVTYFSEDADYIRTLAHQAYYDTPEAAFGLQTEVNIYPDQALKENNPSLGSQRIVEVLLTYPEDPEELRQKSAELSNAADTLLLTIHKQLLHEEELVTELISALNARITACTEALGEGTPIYPSSAYAALVEGAPDSEGAALAFQLLCDKAGVECTVVSGTLDGAPHFWNIVTLNGDVRRHVDPSVAEALLLTDTELTALGVYAWDTEEVAPCLESVPIPDL